MPAALAAGTDLGSPDLLDDEHPRTSPRRKIRFDHVVEQITARHPTGAGSQAAGRRQSAPMLAMYVTARDASGGPVLVLDVVLPGDRHELEDAYQVS